MKVIVLFKNKWILPLIVIILIIPFIINLMFKIPAPFLGLEYEAEAGDSIGAYTSILSTIGTFFLGYVAYKQNERLLQLEVISKKSYVLFDKNNSDFALSKDGKYQLWMYFKNFSDIPIVEWDILSSNENIITGFSNEEVHITSILNANIVEEQFDNECLEISYESVYNKSESFIISYILILTSVYGYKTKLLINLLVCSNGIAEVKVKEVRD